MIPITACSGAMARWGWRHEPRLAPGACCASSRRPRPHQPPSTCPDRRNRKGFRPNNLVSATLKMLLRCNPKQAVRQPRSPLDWPPANPIGAVVLNLASELISDREMRWLSLQQLGPWPRPSLGPAPGALDAQGRISHPICCKAGVATDRWPYRESLACERHHSLV